MKFVARSAALAALVAFAAPAGAVPYTYTFNFSGSSSTEGAVGNAVTVNNVTPSGGNDGYSGPMSVSATAYTKDNSGANAGTTNGTVAKAFLGNYSTGLGVSNAAEMAPAGATGSPAHTVDNESGADFVVFHFDRLVNLTSTTLNLFDAVNGADSGTSATKRDGDFSFGYVKQGSSLNANGTTLAAMNITMLSSISNIGYQNGTDPLTNQPISAYVNGAPVFSYDWVIMADMVLGGANHDSSFDDFKITNVKVQSAVPEPATWAMMIAGFGFVGASLRRKNRAAAVTA